MDENGRAESVILEHISRNIRATTTSIYYAVLAKYNRTTTKASVVKKINYLRDSGKIQMLRKIGGEELWIIETK